MFNELGKSHPGIKQCRDDLAESVVLGVGESVREDDVVAAHEAGHVVGFLARGRRSISSRAQVLAEFGLNLSEAPKEQDQDG
jgi:hypothetical protein